MIKMERITTKKKNLVLALTLLVIGLSSYICFQAYGLYPAIGYILGSSFMLYKFQMFWKTHKQTLNIMNCPRCKGSGRSSTKKYSFGSGITWANDNIECPSCEGKGRCEFWWETHVLWAIPGRWSYKGPIQ